MTWMSENFRQLNPTMTYITIYLSFFFLNKELCNLTSQCFLFTHFLSSLVLCHVLHFTSSLCPFSRVCLVLFDLHAYSRLFHYLVVVSSYLFNSLIFPDTEQNRTRAVTQLTYIQWNCSFSWHSLLCLCFCILF